MMVKPILFVEDDPVLGRGLTVSLELEGYQVKWVTNLKDAHEEVNNTDYQLIVLDLGLPDGHGFQLLRYVRAQAKKIPVLILTAQTDEDSVVEGLSAGANDYVRKPFGHKELSARLKALLRGAFASSEQLAFGELQIQLEQRKVVFQGKEVELNRREFDLITVLVQNAETVVTREYLLQALKLDVDSSDRTIDSHVSHLRSRLRNAGVASVQIGSVYGVGYRLEKR